MAIPIIRLIPRITNQIRITRIITSMPTAPRAPMIMATIMAIISARQGTQTTNLYTLITDAPMSVFGEDYTMGFCRTVSKVYRQSIIMSKEFHKNLALREQLLNDPEVKLGKVYQIEPTIPEAERSNRNSLATLITPLN